MNDFSVNLRVVAMKLLELTELASPTLSITLISYGVEVRYFMLPFLN